MAVNYGSYFGMVLPRTGGTTGNHLLPPDFAHTQEGVWRNLFFYGETISFPLRSGTFSDQAPRSQAIGSWQVLNVEGQVVRTGGPIPASQTALTVPGPLPLGWYRVLFFRDTPLTAPPWEHSAGGGMFAVITGDKAGMRSRPNLHEVGAEGLFDPGTRGMLGFAPFRMSAVEGRPNDRLLSTNYTDLDRHVIKNQQQVRAWDSVRPCPWFINFPDSRFDDLSKQGQITELLERYPQVDWFEGFNEPAVGFSPGWGEMHTQYANLSQMIHTVRPSAKVFGPCPVVISPQHIGPGGGIRYFFEQGGGDHIDGVSWHQYNSLNGDLTNGRRAMDAWLALLVEFGQQNKPRLISESGHFFGHMYGAFTPRKQAQMILLEMMLCEQYGIPKENYSYYYDRNGGYEAQPGHMMTMSDLPFPIIPMLRVYGQQLFEALYESRLDFGTVDNNLALGSTFRRPNGTGVAVLMAAGVRALPVICQVTGNPTTMRVVDAWGNSSARVVEGGLLPLTLGVDPVYVQLRDGEALTVVGRTYGPNLLVGQPAESPQTQEADLGKVTNDYWENPYQYDTGQSSSGLNGHSIWQTNGTMPCEVSVPFPSGAVNTVIVHAPMPWQALNRPLDYDVQVRKAGQWRTVSTYLDTPEALNHRSTSLDGANSWVETYEDHAHVHIHRFPRVTRATGVRLWVRKTTWGVLPDEESALAFGGVDTDGNVFQPGLTFDHHVYGTRLQLQELSAFDDPAYVAPSGPRYLVGPIR